MAVPPDFVSGQVLTAAQMNAIGMWLIKKQTIGTGVSSVQVTDAFSADYDNYRVIITGGAGSANSSLRLTLGATVTAYYQGGMGSTYAGASNTGNGSNAAFWAVGNGTASALFSTLDLYSPFLTDETFISGHTANADTSGAAFTFTGYLNNTTSYTAFTITPSTGTLTGGTIRVYGYRN